MQVNIAAEVDAEIKKNLADQDAQSIQAEISNQRQVDFKSSMTVAAGFEPSKFAQALQVERKSGIPAKVAYDNWDQIEQVKQQDRLAGLFAASPRTAEALSTPSNAIVAKGDEDNLQRMERAIQKSDFYEQGYFERQIAGNIREWWDTDTLADTSGRVVQLNRITSDFDRVDAGDEFSSPWANEYRNADSASKKIMRDNANLERNLSFDRARVAKSDLNKMPVDPTDIAFQEADGVSGVFGVLADDPMWAGRVAVQSLPDMAQSLLAGLINPLLGGVSEGVTSANYKFMEVLQQKGIDVTDPVQLMQALRNDDLLNEANERSARYGAGIGAVSMASFGLLGQVLAPTRMGGKALSSGTREWINAGVQVPVQGGLEALGELTGQVAERGKISDVNTKEVVLEGVIGALMAGPEAGVFATKRFTNHMIQSRRTERAAGVQSELVAGSLESSTRKNDPASFESIVGAQLAGQPNEYIEIPAAKLQELNQSGQVNIPELLEQVGIDPNHYTAQVELGGTIRMKNSSYLAYLSEQDEFLSSSIRVSSNDYSLDEVQELDKQMVADMERIASQFGQTDQIASAYSDVMGQLLGAGYERGAADTTARQYAAVMTRLAQQTGQTVEEVMAANPLTIGREIPKQVRRVKGDELSLMLGRLRAGDIPQSADMFGKTLTEYLTAAGGLDDTGGELAGFDADVGKVGRNRLARTGGQSMDTAALAAFERGYFPGVAREDVTPNMLVDALREEAAGNPRYSVEQENATLRDQAASLDALQSYLDEQGIDLENTTDEQVLALLSGQGNTASQDGTVQEGARVRDDGTDATIAGGDLTLLHGSPIADMSWDKVEIVRAEGQKQGKKGRVYGGFYTTLQRDIEQAQGYAEVGDGTPTIYNVKVKEGTKVLNKDGDITRLSEAYIAELVAQGYGVVAGQDPRGRTEYVVINKNAVESLAPRGEQTLNQSARFSEDNRLSNLSMTGPSWDRIRAANSALAKIKSSNDQVTIYRATVGGKIRPDDFVAVSRDVAEMELENVRDRDGAGEIVEQQVPVRDLLMANDATEFVYFPESRTLNQSATGQTARELSVELEAQHPGLKLDLLGSGDRVTLSRIVLPKEGRGQGVGTAVMQRITEWADQNGKTVGLTPSGDFGGSKSRLPGFYKRFGFVENKGKNRDFEISEAMFRVSRTTLNQSQQVDEATGLPLNADGTVTVYHHTSKENAEKIAVSGVLKASAEPDVYVTSRKETDTGYGDTAVAIRVKPETLQIDDEFPDGRIDFRIDAKRPSGSVNVLVGEAPAMLQQSGPEDARGSITFGPRQNGVRQFDIRLDKKSDLSTVLHEMGHYYLEVIGDLVTDGKANEALAADYAVVREWMGAEAGKPITVDQHEKFARGFELYLAEGKAPSIELQGAFARFKRWLTGIYKDLKRLNVELSPEVRGVFDRLLASEEAITEAEQALALSEQYESSITKLMTPEERANYTRASRQARDEATTEIEQEILRAEKRKDQEWYRDQRKKVGREVRDELESSQPYQARKYLFGNTPHPQLGRVLRLDTAAVTEMFGTKSKEARFLGRARAKENGVHPEIAASILGYNNPVEMLTDMRSVPSLAEAIKSETERRMAARYPDPRVDGTLAEKAMVAVGEREAEVQAIQLRTLAREAGRKASQHRVIKEAARQHIAKLRLRDVIPYTFQRASTKAAKEVEAALLDGNMPKAYEAKEKQLMNLHLYREAVKAQELAQKKRDQAKAYMKAGTKRKRLQDASVENYELAYPDGRVEYAATKAAAKLAEAEGATVTPLFNFLEQVDQLLTKYEFGIPRKIIRQQREALTTFLASMADQHIVINPAEWILLDRAERTNWKELNIGELEDVVDMIRQIDQMAKNKLMVLKGDKWAEFEPLRDAIVASVEQNASKSRNSQFNKSFGDDIRRWGREWLGLLPADQIARELDGQDELGPVQENITTPVQVAGRNVVIREKAEHQGLADLINLFYTDDQLRGMNDPSKLIAVPEIGDSMTRMQMVMLMANLGNEGNRQALLKEERSIWTAETIQGVMGRLDSNDADFVEALWSWIDKFWPEVSEGEAKRTGVAPAKVQGDPYPVRLSDGKVRVLRGGYFPLKYDGDLSIKTSQDDVANAFKNMTAGRTAKAYTPEGHKIERVGSGGRPVKLDFSVVTSHTNEVIRDIIMTDPVNQAWRFLHDKEVQGSFERSNLKELFTALEIWLQDTAEGEKVDSGYMTASARWLRTGFTANVMLFNLSNSMLNLAGTHPLVVLGKKWAMVGYREAFRPASWDQMYELSNFMREARVESYNKDFALVQDQMKGKGGWRAAMTEAGFYLHNKTQIFIDGLTWMGAYHKGMSIDLAGQELITYADQRVVEASGSGVFADRSAMERGTLSRQTRQNELVRGLTMLAGYMIRKIAIARRRTAETSFKDIGQAINWAVDMALLFTVEGLMFAAVKGNIPDDEDDDKATGWLKTAAWESAAGLGSGLPPFGRPLVAAVQGFGGGSSGIDIFAEQFGNAVQQAKQGDADVTALKALVSLVGTATKTPGIATNRAIDWLDRAGDGETPPWWELFTGNRNK
jgi:GNAT superfamily N-acetyltransferase